jgi:hypothetical protein
MMAEADQAAGAQLTFGCTKDELKTFMELRGTEACEHIQSTYGGTVELCKRLCTSPTTGK